MLRIGRIKFELCAQHKKGQTSRSYRVTLNPDTVRLLVDKLEIVDVRTFLKQIVIGEMVTNTETETIEDLLSHPHEVHMALLMTFLRKGLRIDYSHDYSHTLHNQEIMLKGDHNHARFQFECILNSFDARMVVGADGKFSQGE